MLPTSPQIPCPVCKTNIPFDPVKLMNGEAIQCPNPECDAKLSIAAESMETVKVAMDKFTELKAKGGAI